MPWWSGRRRALIVAATGLALLAAGCTGGPPVATETTTPPPVVDTPAPTPTPTPTSGVDVTVKPTRPAALDQPPSVDGAVAVAAYFIELYPYLFATNDQTAWRELSSPECIFCQDVIDDANVMAAAGQRREGGATAISDATGTEIGAGSSYSVDLSMVEEPTRTLDRQRAPVDDWTVATSYRTVVVLLHDGSAWSVRAVEPTEVDQ